MKPASDKLFYQRSLGKSLIFTVLRSFGNHCIDVTEYKYNPNSNKNANSGTEDSKVL